MFLQTWKLLGQDFHVPASEGRDHHVTFRIQARKLEESTHPEIAIRDTEALYIHALVLWSLLLPSELGRYYLDLPSIQHNGLCPEMNRLKVVVLGAHPIGARPYELGCFLGLGERHYLYIWWLSVI